ncbi:tnpA1, partial [Vibrio cholerae HC-55B2]
MPAARHQGRG